MRYRKWRLTTHPDSVSPFTDAAFINFSCELSLSEVTQGNITFIDWKGAPLRKQNCFNSIPELYCFSSSCLHPLLLYAFRVAMFLYANIILNRQAPSTLSTNIKTA